ncbi:PREDICTED: TIMELESS-interacting protein [Nicrophorus vespilloides]|uniref:TIMELESS-interacting protein n=1 Tax=Nicrophorus vespilloides TaxID=110193 RepID=A0ABM1MQJ6_NICVS|nr:PREDICTED: TIMELESS-interacting protein [Nicrophorus vespilloides]
MDTYQSDPEDNSLEVIEEAEEDGEVVTVERVDEDADDDAAAKKVIKPRRAIRNPQPKLNAQTLQGPRGLLAMPELFNKQKFKGKGHEEQDLKTLMKTYEYWCHRLFPKYPFDECISKLEKLGSKKPVITQIKKIRMGLIEPETLKPISEEREVDVPVTEPSRAESQFDALVNKTKKPAADTIQLTEEQLETVRINKERAMRLRQERLRRLEEMAEAKINHPQESQKQFITEISNTDNGKTAEHKSDEEPAPSQTIKQTDTMDCD